LSDDRIDLAREPLSYPGPMVGRSVLLLPDGQQELGGRRELASGSSLNDELRAWGAAPLSARTPVVAVGSNASAGVMRWKLECGGAGLVVPLVRAKVRNLGIAPSAHVSRAGFVPAAPAHKAGAICDVVVGWLDRGQLDCIDRTEPNYRRVRLTVMDYPLAVEPGMPGSDLSHVHVYESRWGVLAGPDGPISLPSQTELAHVLGAFGLEPWSVMEPADAVAMLAGSLPLRERVRALFRARGLAVDSGLMLRT
jgi:hypothetical protein